MSGIAPATPIQIIKSKFEWSVHRNTFDTPVRRGSNHGVHSPEFLPSPKIANSWNLQVNPRGSNDNVEYVGLYLIAQRITGSVRAKYTLGLIANDGTETNTVEYDKIFSAKSGVLSWGMPKFIKRDVLFNPARNLFRENKLTIFCDLEVHLNFDLQKVPEGNLIDGLSGMLESGDLSDVTLVVGKEEIKAHKVVLAAGSEVFAAMFNHNMLENQTGRVEIQDLDIVGVKGLLSFLYSEKVEDLKAIAEKVLPAADKYGVEKLKLMCENELCEKLTVENVVELLTLAELHTAKQLKSHALALIKADSTEILQLDRFWELADVNLDLLKEAVCFCNRDSDGPQAKRRKLN